MSRPVQAQNRRARRARKSWRRGARRFALALTVALAHASAMAAEPEPNADGGAQTDDEITIIRKREESPYDVQKPSLARFPAPLRDIPQSVTIVPQKIIEEQGATTLRDALRNVTGIGVTAGEGGGAQGDSFTLRGYSSRNDMFIDGVRDAGSYFRDSFNVEAIEVLKGPSSTYFGRGSTGGVIEDVYGSHSVKLPAGDLVLYPASSLHRVRPVTRGQRLASFFWVQSMVRDDGARSLLFDLDVAIHQVNQQLGAHPAVTSLTNTYHNLLRRFAEL